MLKDPFDVNYYRANPVQFFRDLAGHEPWPWQVEVMELLNNPGTVRHIAIGTGHGVGKSTMDAVIAWWWFLTRYPSLVAITAPTERQVKRVLFREIKALMRNLPPSIKRSLDTSSLAIKFTDDDSNLIIGSTARPENADAFQGYHSANLLMIVDEASGIHPAIWEAMVGVFSTANSFGIYTGNQTRADGEFYDMMNAERFEGDPQFFRLVVNSEDVPGARGHIEYVQKRWPGDEDKYRVRVLGLPPLRGEDSLISRERVLECVARGRDEEAVKTARSNSPVFPVWGLDVANKGKCSTVLVKRTGYVVENGIKAWKNRDNREISELIMSEYYACESWQRPSSICIEYNGVGIGVSDLLRKEGLPVKNINGLQSASNPDLYRRFRDELWWRAKEWTDNPTSVLLDDNENLINELIAITFEMDPKLIVETKSDFVERLQYSPDYADAFVLTFARAQDEINPKYPFRQFGVFTGSNKIEQDLYEESYFFGGPQRGGSWLGS